MSDKIEKKPLKKKMVKETDVLDTGVLLSALKALKKGDFTVRMPDGDPSRTGSRPIWPGLPGCSRASGIFWWWEIRFCPSWHRL